MSTNTPVVYYELVGTCARDDEIHTLVWIIPVLEAVVHGFYEVIKSANDLYKGVVVSDGFIHGCVG